jgi:hypothetical protein
MCRGAQETLGGRASVDPPPSLNDMLRPKEAATLKFAIVSAVLEVVG